MTNTRVSDLEILEKRYPVMVKQFGIRSDSGGIGLHPGGNGSIRAFQTRAPMTFSLSSERRVHRPYGMAGGGPGKSGINLAILKGVNGKDRVVNVGGKGMIELKTGEMVVVQTPGGGAWGALPANGDVVKEEVIKPKQQFWRGTGSLHAFAQTQNEG
jgi:5-oxoprolinase (ATP-hydrolysing)